MRPDPSVILDYREYPILYVDDEPENLRIFELTFKREFKILTASSGAEGLDVLHSQPVALVLSDHKMPEMTGVEFLSRVCAVDPKTVRIMVTAYGDAETLQAAVNNGSIYRFVSKPWTPEDMRVTLRRGIEVFALERDRSQLLRELTLLNKVSKSINRELEIDPLFDLLVDTITEDFAFDGASLLLFDESRSKLSFGRVGPRDSVLAEDLANLSIDTERAREFTRRLEDGVVQVLSIDDALELEPTLRDWVTEVAAEEILVVPLAGKDSVIGALAVDNRSGGARFKSSDRTLIEGLANQAVIAIQNARHVEDLQSSREQVRRADRLGTLGTMAAGLAHEINNPLVSINTFLSMAPSKRDSDDEEFWGDYHQLATREVERIRRLVETMRRLGREGDAPVREIFDPTDTALEVVTLLQQEASRAQVALQIVNEPEMPKVRAVRDQLHQVVLNLALNAIQASPPGSEVRIRSTSDRAGDAVCLEISDDGPGISEEHLERIFDPFFTTKGPDQGSGLGLMISHRIVTDHGGTIEVSSPEGGGATFRVRLPAASDLGQGAGS